MLEDAQSKDIVTDLEQTERSIFTTLMVLLGAPFLGYFIVSDLLSGRYFVALICMPIFILIALGLPAINKFAGTREKQKQFFNLFYLCFLVSVGILITYLILSEGYSRVPWFYLFPLLSFLILGHKAGLILSIVIFLSLVTFDYLFPNAIPVLVPDIRTRFFVSIILITVISYYLERWRYNYKNELVIALKDVKESEQKYRNLVDSMQEGLFGMDADWRITFVNNRFTEMSGYSHVELKKKKFFDLLSADSKEKVKAGIKKRQIGKAGMYELELLRPDGKPLYILWSPNPSYNANGEYLGGFSVITDITEYKVSTQKLHRSEKKYKFLAENMEDIIWTTDLEFKTTYVSPSIERVLGFTQEERYKQTSEQMLTPESLNKVTQVLLDFLHQETEGILSQEFITIDVEYYTKEGSTVWMENIVKFIRDSENEIMGLLGLSRDIAERKKADDALRKSEEKFRDLVENIDEVIYTLDINGNITYVSPVIESKSGYKQQELIGRPFTEFVHSEDLPRLLEQFQNILSGHLQPNEYRLIAKSGEIYWIRATSRPVYEGDRLIGLRGAMSDITEAKRLERDLQHSYKMESIGTFAGGIAHDFNNIIYMITGNAELALEEIPEWNPVHKNLREIKSAGLRASGIVKQLLNFSRKTDHELKPIGAVSVIIDILKFLRSTLPTTIEMRQYIPDMDVTILADPIQINQVLMNLCTNAFQAMEETGGRLEISVESVTINGDEAGGYAGLSENEYLKITISDTGPGIDSEIIDRIFDPYFTTKEVGKGSGMGLAVVHGIVQNHNGAITVDSELEKGTTFTLLIPTIAEKPVIDIKASAGLRRGKKEKILFVDDEESITNMMASMLERLGYRVEVKQNPVDALDRFRSNPQAFDLVITDMTMPHLNGIAFSRELKHIRSDIPIIICTGHSSLIDEYKANDLDISAYVMKPIVMKEIAKRIREILD